MCVEQSKRRCGRSISASNFTSLAIYLINFLGESAASAGDKRRENVERGRRSNWSYRHGGRQAEDFDEPESFAGPLNPRWNGWANFQVCRNSGANIGGGRRGQLVSEDHSGVADIIDHILKFAEYLCIALLNEVSKFSGVSNGIECGGCQHRGESARRKIECNQIIENRL